MSKVTVTTARMNLRFAGRLHAIKNYMIRDVRRRQLRRDLVPLSNHLLKDIGIVRCEIEAFTREATR